MATKSERFELRIDEEQLYRVDEWAKKQPNQPTRAEAVRRLINLGLSTDSSRAVNLSDGEKMIILMMGDIFKALKIKDPEIDPDFMVDVIRDGHYWAPKWKMQGVFDHNVDNPEDVDYVADVLTMWSYIEGAYAQLSPTQKDKLVDKVGTWATHLEFSGFDGNHESSQMSIARFLVNKMGRFPQFKTRDLNSHCPTNSRYRCMLDVFEPMRETLGGGDLNLQQLVVLLKSNRLEQSRTEIEPIDTLD